MLNEVRGTSLKSCDPKGWGEGTTAGRGQEKSNTCFSLAPCGRSWVLYSPQTQRTQQENPRTLWDLSRPPEFITFSTSLRDSVSFKLLSNIHYPKILLLTFATQMFLEWPCCRTGATAPPHASPRTSTFWSVFYRILSHATLSLSFGKKKYILTVTQFYRIVIKIHYFYLHQKAQLEIRTYGLRMKFVCKHMPLVDKYPDCSSTNNGKLQRCQLPSFLYYCFLVKDGESGARTSTLVNFWNIPALVVRKKMFKVWHAAIGNQEGKWQLKDYFRPTSWRNKMGLISLSVLI